MTVTLNGVNLIMRITLSPDGSFPSLLAGLKFSDNFQRLLDLRTLSENKLDAELDYDAETSRNCPDWCIKLAHEGPGWLAFSPNRTDMACLFNYEISLWEMVS